jgi:hypothetical protein
MKLSNSVICRRDISLHHFDFNPLNIIFVFRFLKNRYCEHSENLKCLNMPVIAEKGIWTVVSVNLAVNILIPLLETRCVKIHYKC